MKRFLALAFCCLFFLMGCTPKTVISSTYDFDQVQRIGIMSFENRYAALRGVDVRIMLPHIPDKKMVFAMSRSFYPRLMAAGVKIYEYTPGFLHAKCYLADDDRAVIGSINLDYRSLVHHFENGVWMYRCECLCALKKDMETTFAKSLRVQEADLRIGLIQRVFRAVIRVFAPLL